MGRLGMTSRRERAAAVTALSTSKKSVSGSGTSTVGGALGIQPSVSQGLTATERGTRSARDPGARPPPGRTGTRPRVDSANSDTPVPGAVR